MSVSFPAKACKTFWKLFNAKYVLFCHVLWPVFYFLFFPQDETTNPAGGMQQSSEREQVTVCNKSLFLIIFVCTELDTYCEYNII